MNCLKKRPLRAKIYVSYSSLVIYPPENLYPIKKPGDVPYTTVYTTPPVITFRPLKDLSPGVLYSGGVIYSVFQ